MKAFAVDEGQINQSVNEQIPVMRYAFLKVIFRYEESFRVGKLKLFLSPSLFSY
jgi:hypothetical protein